MKDFLEHYGFAILTSIVVVLLIAMSTPVNNLIKNKTTSIIEGFANRTETKLSSVFIEDTEGNNQMLEPEQEEGTEPLTKEQAQLLGNYVAEDGEVFSSLEDLLIYQSQNEYLTCFVFADITGNELDDFLYTNNLPNQLQNLIIDNDTIALNEGIETNNLNINTGTLTLGNLQISNSEITAENVVFDLVVFVNNVVNVSSTANLHNSNLENTVVNARTAGVVLNDATMYNSIINLGNEGCLSVNGDNTTIIGTLSEVFPYTGSFNNGITNRIILNRGTYTDPEVYNMPIAEGYEVRELNMGNVVFYRICRIQQPILDD